VTERHITPAGKGGIDPLTILKRACLRALTKRAYGFRSLEALIAMAASLAAAYARHCPDGDNKA
jgi:hypothetical protein